ncbi:hypothetical protein PF010_g19948 [Phytophthora fragariae]|uniref:Uncharacterized protein n=1 Tax=Phytophthora fragariae TaxID=53985 RepID=A0A6G0KFX2_9STRA|nr:hypothetical protein PF010_g19948 [Phytophthora fragariae]
MTSQLETLKTLDSSVGVVEVAHMRQTTLWSRGAGVTASNMFRPRSVLDSGARLAW